VHSDGEDQRILHECDVVATLLDLKRVGEIRYIGFSGKTVDGAVAAMEWADALMVEYHLDDRSHAAAMAQAAERGVGVIVKKPLASGRLPPQQAVGFVLANPAVTSTVVGGLNLDHLRDNVAISLAVSGQALPRQA
jgi:aryl-alcohol dehydrogenase-like predicted oxidoreductase